MGNNESISYHNRKKIYGAFSYTLISATKLGLAIVPQ